jgi:16S rRNA (cytosine967-C5)-methyltransferase
MERWIKTYGEQTARAFAAMHAEEPPLDVTVKSDPATWATHLHGRVLPTGTVRTVASGAISLLPGYAEGKWWIQDAAAALPTMLFGDVRGRNIADICAAPGGKTMQLANAGAIVTAIDRSTNRLVRVRENLARLSLNAETVATDVMEWQGGPFDAVLVDAPCSSTGTIRRHPDIPWLKQEIDITVLAGLQSRLLDRAVALTKPGGTIIYCTCSLEPEEGEQQITALLTREHNVKHRPITTSEIGGLGAVTPNGDLRTLPCHLPDPNPRMAGLDGFFAARLERL